jgi:hypothetical protein
MLFEKQLAPATINLRCFRDLKGTWPSAVRRLYRDLAAEADFSRVFRSLASLSVGRLPYYSGKFAGVAGVSPEGTSLQFA